MERPGATQHGHFRDGRVVVGEFSGTVEFAVSTQRTTDGFVGETTGRANESAYATDNALRVYPKFRRRKSVLTASRSRRIPRSDV